MAFYELQEFSQDDRRFIHCNLRRDGTIILDDVTYSAGIEYVYTVIRQGDTYQETGVKGDKRPILSYDEISNSVGMRAFIRRSSS